MIREIHIKAVLNGFIVNVGCQTVVFAGDDAAKQLADSIGYYVSNPKEAEAGWLKSINGKHTYHGENCGGEVRDQTIPVRLQGQKSPDYTNVAMSR